MFTTLISVEELSNRLGREDLIVVDCRYGPEEKHRKEAYLKGHIPGARYADMDKELAAPHQADVTGRHPLPEVQNFAATLGGWGISNQSQVVVYDQGIGGFAARLWWMLRWVGHDAVAVLDGGWSRWVMSGFAESTSIPEPTTKEFKVTLRPELLVTLDHIETNLENPDMQLIDSRSNDRYLGKNEPFDPIAGHIPGAISLPFTENTVNGRLRSRDELLKRFEENLNFNADETVFYCGSGVTACHNILSWKHAGLGDARLYVGSWSEWITGGNRPMIVPDEDKS